MKRKRTVLVTTWPFADQDRRPLLALKRGGFLVLEPARQRRLKLAAAEVRQYLPLADAVIAGTELYDAAMLAAAGPRSVVRNDFFTASQSKPHPHPALSLGEGEGV